MRTRGWIGGVVMAGGLALGGSAGAQVTSFSYQSQAGDYIGQGLTRSYTPTDGPMTIDRSALNTVHFSFRGNTVPNGPWWDVYFAAPQGETLTARAYEGAMRWPFQAATAPGLSMFGEGRGCNTLTGRFVVHEVEFGPGNQVVRFSADFEQHCDGMTPALFGQVRWNVPGARVLWTAAAGLGWAARRRGRG